MSIRSFGVQFLFSPVLTVFSLSIVHVFSMKLSVIISDAPIVREPSDSYRLETVEVPASKHGIAPVKKAKKHLREGSKASTSDVAFLENYDAAIFGNDVLPLPLSGRGMRLTVEGEEDEEHEMRRPPPFVDTGEPEIDEDKDEDEGNKKKSVVLIERPVFARKTPKPWKS